MARPVWAEFPREAAARECDTQLLLGPSILTCPVLEPAAVSRQCYLPGDLWYCTH